MASRRLGLPIQRIGDTTLVLPRPPLPPPPPKPKLKPGQKPRVPVPRTRATYRYVCPRCTVPTDNAILCRCGQRSMIRNPAFEPALYDTYMQSIALGKSGGSKPVEVRSMSEVIKFAKEIPRLDTGVEFLDYVLGGGIVRGKAYLMAGGPGSGKSTLWMQALLEFGRPNRRGIYISGEEEVDQVANRAGRLVGYDPDIAREAAFVRSELYPGYEDENEDARAEALAHYEAEREVLPLDRQRRKRVLDLRKLEEPLEVAMADPRLLYLDQVHTTYAGEAAGAIRDAKAALAVVDSLQVIGDMVDFSDAQLGSGPQVTNLMKLCIEEARKANTAVVFICQITKNGEPSGPKAAEHLVDVDIRMEKLDAEAVTLEPIEEPLLDRHGQPRFDRDGNPKVKVTHWPSDPRGQYRRLYGEKNRFAHGEEEVVLELRKDGLWRAGEAEFA